MNIWIVNAQENPPEPRSNKGRRQWRSNSLSEELADRGHKVVRWRSSFSHQKKQQLSDNSAIVKLDNYQQQFIYSPSYKNHVGLKRRTNHIKLAKEFLRLARSSEKPDVINVCNVPLELCEACVTFGKENNIPVIIDIRDLWPDSYVNFIPNWLSFLKGPALWFVNNFFRKVTYSYKTARALTAISDPILEWGLRKAPREKSSYDAVFPMTYPKLSESIIDYNEVKIKDRFGISEESLVACYSGNIGYQTDFDTFFSAAHELRVASSPIHFVIAGSGPREDELRARASSMSNVTVVGWLSGSELSQLFHISSFGLIGFFNITDYIFSLPNKFSEYLSAGLALVCGTKGEMERLINEYDCGITYDSMNSVSLATNLTKLSKNRSELERIKRNAQNLHKSHFDLDVVIPKLADHTEDIAIQHNHND